MNKMSKLDRHNGEQAHFYNPKLEYRVDITSAESTAKIQRSQKLYRDFLINFEHYLDLKNPQSIQRAYLEAEKKGVFRQAKKMRKFIFGKDMHFYGVSYLWDKCANYCAYCPGSVCNRKKILLEEAREYPLGCELRNPKQSHFHHKHKTAHLR